MRERGPFETHVREAIALNLARRPGYVARGGARASLVSRVLVGSERALLPIARRLDRRAAALGQTEALASVLMPMHDAPPADRPVSTSGTAPVARLGAALVPLLATTDRAFRRRDHTTASRLTATLLGDLRERTEADDVYLAMAVHLAESAALGASRAHQASVLVSFVRWHLLGLPLALVLDALAAPLHARGVGILVNDLPPIPVP
ncbi:MAG: hypothetical protein AAF791_14645 [Bacteroidota bacterium]